VPGWAEDETIGNKLINARSETAREKPSFRAAFKRTRCVVPMTGFYEWRAMEGGKQPYFISRADDDAMLAAGLWEHWDGDERTRPLETFTILTTRANEALSALHERMPCLLEREDVGAWLGAGEDELERAEAVLRPAPDGVLRMHPVSTRVNSPKHDGPDLLERVEIEEQGGLFG